MPCHAPAARSIAPRVRCRGAGRGLFLVAAAGTLVAVTVFVSGCRSARAERTIAARINAPVDEPLTMVTRFRHGSMHVAGASTGGWRLNATVTVWAGDQETADAIAADLTVVARRKGSQLVVAIEPESGQWAPEDYRLAIRSDFRVPYRTGLDVVTSHGKLVVEDLAADVKGRTTHGAIELRRIEGDTDCRSTHGAIRVESLTGRRHRLASTHGGATLSGVEGAIEVTTTHGSITADLGVVRGGASRLSTTHGNVTCQVSPRSDVAIAARTSHGGVRSTIPGARTELSGSSGRVVIGDGGGELAIRTTHGRVRLEASQADSVHRVR